MFSVYAIIQRLLISRRKKPRNGRRWWWDVLTWCDLSPDGLRQEPSLQPPSDVAATNTLCGCSTVDAPTAVAIVGRNDLVCDPRPARPTTTIATNTIEILIKQIQGLSLWNYVANRWHRSKRYCAGSLCHWLARKTNLLESGSLCLV